MATMVSLCKVWLTPLKLPTLNTPTGCKYLGYIPRVGWVIANFVSKLLKYQGHISYTSRVMANFVLTIGNFRYHGNRGRSEQILTDTLKSADHYNPWLGASIRIISLTQAELWPILCWKSQIFVTMTTGVGLSKVWLTQLNWPTLKTLL